MVENFDWKSNDDEHLQEESSSCHLLGALEDLLKRSHSTSIVQRKKISYQSKSLDDLLLHRSKQNSNIIQTEFDLSCIAGDDDDDDDEFSLQRSRSAPVSPTKIYEKELAAFVDCDREYFQQTTADNFVYNIDLSDDNDKAHETNSKLAAFFDDDDDYASEEINSRPITNHFINPCLTIEEENEEEEEEDFNENENMPKYEHSIERLSTIYESPSPQIELDDNPSEKLIIYDYDEKKQKSLPVIHSPIIPSRSSPILYPLNINQSLISFPHVKKMRVIQSTSSSLSDFISSSSVPSSRSVQQTIYSKILSDSSSSTSSDGLSSSDENLLQPKTSSLNILYPIDFHNSEQLKQYQQNLTELNLIKTTIVDIDSRLNEAMREVQIEQALIEGEHELVFKQILEASENDQENIRQLQKNLHDLTERMMTEKLTLRNEIEYTEKFIVQLEEELERNTRSSDENIFRKKQMLNHMRKKHEDLEFQYMEFETRCESELEQAEIHFQNQQKLVSQNAKFRQDTLRELDHQQTIIFQQASIEKEQLEHEKQELKNIFQQKKIEIDQFEERFHRVDDVTHVFDKVQLRDKTRLQERPLTRYLPIRSADFDLRAHIESAGHQLNSNYISISSTMCRGYLYKMGGMKFKTWNRRWFVFDRQCQSLNYYQDKTQRKLRGQIAFQSILEVYVDHLQSISLRSPEPREATFIVKTIGKSYYLVAPTIETMRIWIDVLITGAQGNIFATN